MGSCPPSSLSSSVVLVVVGSCRLWRRCRGSQVRLGTEFGSYLIRLQYRAVVLFSLFCWCVSVARRGGRRKHRGKQICWHALSRCRRRFRDCWCCDIVLCAHHCGEAERLKKIDVSRCCRCPSVVGQLVVVVCLSRVKSRCVVFIILVFVFRQVVVFFNSLKVVVLSSYLVDGAKRKSE